MGMWLQRRRIRQAEDALVYAADRLDHAEQFAQFYSREHAAIELPRLERRYEAAKERLRVVTEQRTARAKEGGGL